MSDLLSLTRNRIKTFLNDIYRLPAGTVASDDLMVINDISNGNKPKRISVQSVADLSSSSEWTYLTPIDTTSGTSHSFTIPSGAKEVEVMYEDVSHDGSNKHLVQLGDSGGIEITGYNASGTNFTSSALSSATETTGFPLGASNTGSNDLNGTVKLSLAEASSNLWAMEGVMSGDSTTLQMIGAGTKALSAELTTVRVTSFNITNNFNGGTAHCRWR